MSSFISCGATPSSPSVSVASTPSLLFRLRVATGVRLCFLWVLRLVAALRGFAPGDFGSAAWVFGTHSNHRREAGSVRAGARKTGVRGICAVVSLVP